MLRLSIILLLLIINQAMWGGEARAASLLINQHNTYPAPWGYGNHNWDDMAAALDSAFGADNITVSDAQLDDLGLLMSFDRLWITTPLSSDPGLTAEEQANLSAFIASGRRVVLLGENNNWTDWNISILSTVDGVYSGNHISTPLRPQVIHPITLGITELTTVVEGTATGGTSLFDHNVVTLWGEESNVVSVLSVHFLSDSNTGDHARFRTNLAQWLAVPEPTTCTLALAALYFGMSRRRISAR